MILQMSTRERGQGTLKTKQKHVKKRKKKQRESREQEIVQEIDNGEFDPGSG